MNNVKSWQQALAGALLVAGLASACSGAPADEPYSAPTLDDTQTLDYESNVTNSYHDDADYDLGDYYESTLDPSMLQVGFTLSPSLVEDARETLRNMDNEERAGRVVIERDGQFVVADAGDLNSDDVIEDEDVARIWAAGRWMPVRVVDGENVVWNPRQPAPQFAIQDAVAQAGGGGRQSQQFQHAENTLDSLGLTAAEAAELDARWSADVPAPNEMPTEIILFQVARPDRGITLVDNPNHKSWDGNVYSFTSVGGTQGAGAMIAGGSFTLDNVINVNGSRSFSSLEAARAHAARIVAQHPNVIFHDMTN